MPDYQVKFQTIAIGNVNFCVRSLQDCQQFSDPQGIAANLGISSAMWPLFGMVWPSSLILAKTMSQFPIQGKRILEIGCGIALASLVLHQRGANITASDYHPLAEDFLLQNAALNHLHPINFQPGNWATANPWLGKFDLIIGSDVLYEQGHPNLLADFIDQHSYDQVEVMVVDPGRGNHSKFSRAMVALGHICKTEKLAPQEIQGIPYKGRILHYHRDYAVKVPIEG